MTIPVSSRTHTVNGYSLNQHDIIRLVDGTLAYVLRQDYDHALMWLCTPQKVLCVSQFDEFERLVNIEAVLAESLSQQTPPLNVEQLRHALLGKAT